MSNGTEATDEEYETWLREASRSELAGECMALIAAVEDRCSLVQGVDWERAQRTMARCVEVVGEGGDHDQRVELTFFVRACAILKTASDALDALAAEQEAGEPN